jgi:hypothetical protein
MKLRRIALYRATRILSWVLPVVIIVFISIAVWSYWVRTRNGEAIARADGDELPSDVAVRTRDVQYEASEGNRKLFKVNAHTMLGFKDKRKLLEDVEVLIYAQKPGDPDRRIGGKECTHDEETNHVSCRRKVSVELEPGTIAQTEQLSYDPATAVISSPVRTSLDRAGEMTGNSGRMDYLVDRGLMRLTDGFEIRLNRGGGMKGGAADFQYKENWVSVSKGVELTSMNGKIQGGTGRADLLPGTYRPQRITVETGASADAPSFSVNSDWVQSELSEAGSIEHVLSRGNVRAERRASVANEGSGADSLNGTLTGPEVEAWFENGSLKIVEARQRPSFDATSGKLDAVDWIRIEPARTKSGSLRTQGISTFKRDGLTIEGSNFEIDVRDDTHEQIFNTSARATLTSADLKTTADTTSARFDTNSKALASMQQQGKVTFEDGKGKRTGSSESLTVLDGGNRIVMEKGVPQVTDAQGTLRAPGGRITLDRKRGSFTGVGGDRKITMTSAGSGTTPVVILAKQVEGQLEGENPRVEYKGAVEMYPPDGSKTDADHLLVFPNEKRFEADGNVRSSGAGDSQQKITAQRLDFRDRENIQIAHYTGAVKAQGFWGPMNREKQAAAKGTKKTFLELQARDLVIQSRNGDLDRIVAEGAVDLTRGVQRGRGERFEYNVATGDILLTGTPSAEAEVSEPDRSAKGCTVQIAADGGKTVTPCSDRRATSSFPIKK